MQGLERADQRNTSPFAPLLARAKREGRPDVHFGKRRHARFTLGVTLVASTRVADLEHAWPVVMVNISEEGMAVRSNRSVPRGDPLYLNDAPAANAESWVQAKVMHCTRTEEGYVIGISLRDAVTR